MIQHQFECNFCGLRSELRPITNEVGVEMPVGWSAVDVLDSIPPVSAPIDDPDIDAGISKLPPELRKMQQAFVDGARHHMHRPTSRRTIFHACPLCAAVKLERPKNGQILHT